MDTRRRSSSETAFLTNEDEKAEMARLEEANIGVYDSESGYGRKRSSSWIRRHWKAVGWHLLFNAFTLVLLVFGVGDIWDMSGLCKSPVHDPGMKYKKYEVVELEYADEDTNKFKPFTDEADKAWHDLMDYTYVRLREEDLKAINKTSVPLGDGGYLGMPVMFHEVHCVKILRWATNLDRYTKEFGERDLVDLPKHASHCIDTLRQSIMCRADLSPNVFYWTEGKRTPHSEFYSAHHCASWDSVMDYLRENHVQVNAPGILNHPIYGPSYPGQRRRDEKWDTPEILPPIPYEGPMAI
ncbi:hypothetical protein F5Y17DRAFT_417839 [Xylariaceae sp. FL0594]|nr:hypothetical protein F5Y17DRAFT_417839 [Xylariaceae sp. FL0594]